MNAFIGRFTRSSTFADFCDVTVALMTSRNDDVDDDDDVT